MNINYLINEVLKYNQNKEDILMIEKAYEFAKKLHEGQKRLSGEEYIIHPIAVATILAEIEADTNSVIAGLLHDILEDTDTTKEEIIDEFNLHVANLVDGVTKIGKIKFSSVEEEKAGNTRKLLNGITEDVRIIIIKLADRLHNMRTLEFKSPEKRKTTALETMEIFVPLSYYLGCYKIKNELEDLSFRYINPRVYSNLTKELKKIYAETKSSIEEMINQISKKLSDNNISSFIESREKNVYGIYKAMQNGYKIHEVHDMLALRIMVNDIKDCYQAFGIIHSLYPPVNEKFKDYIAVPKTNMYQSLHSTLFGAGENLVQAQIRTFEMDRVAKLGITKYWQDPKVMMNDELRNRFQFFKSLVKINEITNDNKSFLEDIKQDIFGTNIYVYTVNGEVIELPQGSTGIDFAYKIHTDVGHNMVGIIVNGDYEDVGVKLKNKDIVKIITSELNSGPDIKWLEMCKTVLAKKMIKNYHKK